MQYYTHEWNLQNQHMHGTIFVFGKNDIPTIASTEIEIADAYSEGDIFMRRSVTMYLYTETVQILRRTFPCCQCVQWALAYIMQEIVIVGLSHGSATLKPPSSPTCCAQHP